MMLRIRVPQESVVPQKPLGLYSLRPSSFLASVGLHGLVIVLAALAPPQQVLPVAATPQSVWSGRKVIYYDLRRPLPQVSPSLAERRVPNPARGVEKSSRTVIATSPRPLSQQQLVWLPAPRISLKQDLVAPDLIARLRPSMPRPPMPPSKQDPAPAPAPAQVEPAAQRAPPKQFVPPPPVTRPKLPLPATMVSTGAPAIPSTGSLADGPSIPGLAAGAPQFPPGPPVPSDSQGNASVDVAVVSASPVGAAKGELPTGDRPGAFSQAPAVGAPSPGPGGNGGLLVPNLSVSSSVPGVVPPVKPPLPPKRMLYAERVRSAYLSSLSVPLRPSNRMVPRMVEARFHGRNVYTMVVPIENIPAYGGDWIMWFAEKEPRPGENPVVRAPVPFRKTELVEEAPPANRTERRVQMAATIRADGTIGAVSLLTVTDPAVRQMVLEDTASWEFKPATRNGEPVEVEVVLEIPFNLPLVLAQRAQP